MVTLVLLGLTAWFAWQGASGSWQYYLTVDEFVAQGECLRSVRVRLGGKVAQGTLAGPMTRAIAGRPITLGPAFYNTAAAPLALILLGAMGMVPLVRWGGPPPPGPSRRLKAAAALAVASALMAWMVGVRHGFGVAVVGLAVLALGTLVSAITGDFGSAFRAGPWRAVARLALARRRQYAGYAMHLGFVSLVAGIAGSSLASKSIDITLAPGQTFHWSGYAIRLLDVQQKLLADKRVVQTRLEVQPARGSAFELVPAQHFHFSTQEWTAEVAVRSAWWGDLYAVAHGGSGNQHADLTFRLNPLMRCIWASGFLAALGTVAALWPSRRRAASPAWATRDGLPERKRPGKAHRLQPYRPGLYRSAADSAAAPQGAAVGPGHRDAVSRLNRRFRRG